MWRWVAGHLEAWLNVVFYAYLTSVIVVEVSRRYLFHAPSAWGEETAVYAYIWMTYLGCARRVRERTHLRVEIVPNRLGRTGNFVLYMVSDLCFLALSGVVFATSVQMVVNNVRFHQTFIGADVPMWLATLAVPVGWTFIAVRIVERCAGTIRAFREGRPITPSVGADG